MRAEWLGFGMNKAQAGPQQRGGTVSLASVSQESHPVAHSGAEEVREVQKGDVQSLIISIPTTPGRVLST